MSTGLAIFVKTPGLSPVKTRLAAAIGQLRAEQFHRLAAACAAAAAQAAGETITPYWAVAEAEGLHDAQWLSLPRLAQGEGDLGVRMAQVYDHLLARHGSVLLIGADIPQVQPVDLVQAAAAACVGNAPWVLGPTADGGFWLVGGRSPIPAAAWLDTPWSQPDTAARFCDALRPAPARLAVLRDVDTYEDLRIMLAGLRTLSEPTTEQRTLLQSLHHWDNGGLKVRRTPDYNVDAI